MTTRSALAVLLAAILVGHAHTVTAQTAPRPAISYGDLARALENRITRVPEFAFIRKEAERLGVRAYLFGGTAAAYAHYVMNDLLREGGDTRYQSERFDYDYTSIYYASQDLDIVIDGTPEQAKQFESAVVQKFPYFKGARGEWDVRLLRSTVGDREALLDNPDFLNQHTDSDSTGLIEVTTPGPNEDPVKDLRDWNSNQPNFLKDVRDGTIHYYYSPNHDSTSRAARGYNPSIISVIRYFTKVFQYDLKMQPKDEEAIERAIDAFNPTTPMTDYVRHWIEKNGKKLFFNAANIEYAWDTLNAFGLRQKLIEMGGQLSDPNSLAYWMNKEPLRSFPVGTGDGETAKELGIDIVAHETRTLRAYESITKSPIGGANAFVSRQSGNANEYAMHGTGFYTIAGRCGASSVGSGYSVRFHLNPNARLHTDFEVVPWDNARIIVVENKRAITVIHEVLNVSFLQFFKMLESGYYARGQGDMALVDRLKRKLNRPGAVSQQESDEVAELIRQQLSFKPVMGQESSVPSIVEEWFSWPSISSRYPDIVEKLLMRGDENKYLIVVLAKFPGEKYKRFIEQILNERRPKAEQSEIDNLVAHHILTQPQWIANSDTADWINALLRRGDADSAIAYALSQPLWQNRPEVENWLVEIVKRGRADHTIVNFILTQTRWSKRSDWTTAILNRDKVTSELMREVLSQPPWHPDLVKQIIEQQPNRALTFLIPNSFWLEYPDLLELFINKNTSNGDIARYILSKPGWGDRPELVDQLIQLRPGEGDQRDIVEDLLGSPQWANHPRALEWLEKMIKMNGTGALASEVTRLTNSTLQQPPWESNTRLREICHGRIPTVECLKHAFQNGVTFIRKNKSCSTILMEPAS